MHMCIVNWILSSLIDLCECVSVWVWSSVCAHRQTFCRRDFFTTESTKRVHWSAFCCRSIVSFVIKHTHTHKSTHTQVRASVNAFNKANIVYKKWVLYECRKQWKIGYVRTCLNKFTMRLPKPTRVLPILSLSFSFSHSSDP